MIIEELINRIAFEVFNKRGLDEASRSMDRMEDQAEGAAKEINELEKEMSKAEKAGIAMGRGIRRGAGLIRGLLGNIFSPLAKALGVSSIGFAGLGAAAIAAASDTEEAQSKLVDVLGNNSNLVENWAKRNAASFNASTNELRKYATDFTVQFQSIANDVESSDFAKTLTERALDLASFSNKSASDVVADFTSALNGSSETVEKYGVNLKQAAIENFILGKGIRRSKKEITEADKRLARYNLLLEGTRRAQGNAARTSGDFANVLRNLRARFVDLLSRVGRKLLPLVTDALKGLTDLIVDNSEVIVKFFDDGAKEMRKFIEDGGLKQIKDGFLEVGKVIADVGKGLAKVIELLVDLSELPGFAKDIFQGKDVILPDDFIPEGQGGRRAGTLGSDIENFFTGRPGRVNDSLPERLSRRGAGLAAVLPIAATRLAGAGVTLNQTLNFNGANVSNPNTVARAARNGAAQGVSGAGNTRAGSGKGA